MGIAIYSPRESFLFNFYTFTPNPSWDISCWGWPNPVSSHGSCAPAPVSHFCSPQLLLPQWRTSCGAHEPTEDGVGSGCTDGCSNSSVAKELGEWQSDTYSAQETWCTLLLLLHQKARKKSGWDGRKWWVMGIICDSPADICITQQGRLRYGDSLFVSPVENKYLVCNCCQLLPQHLSFSRLYHFNSAGVRYLLSRGLRIELGWQAVAGQTLKADSAPSSSG